MANRSVAWNVLVTSGDVAASQQQQQPACVAVLSVCGVFYEFQHSPMQLGVPA
jgi:hypothetical protein